MVAVTNRPMWSIIWIAWHDTVFGLREPRTGGHVSCRAKQGRRHRSMIERACRRFGSHLLRIGRVCQQALAGERRLHSCSQRPRRRGSRRTGRRGLPAAAKQGREHRMRMQTLGLAPLARWFRCSDLLGHWQRPRDQSAEHPFILSDSVSALPLVHGAAPHRHVRVVSVSKATDSCCFLERLLPRFAGFLPMVAVDVCR